MLLLEQDRNLDKTAPPAISSHGSLPADKHKLQQPDMPLLHQRVAKPVLSRNKPHIVLQLLSYTALFTLGLLVLSDMQLRHYPEHFTTSLFKTRVQGATPLPLGTQSPVHWTRHVYGYMLMVGLCFHMQPANDPCQDQNCTLPHCLSLHAKLSETPSACCSHAYCSSTGELHLLVAEGRLKRKLGLALSLLCIMHSGIVFSFAS